jgi:uncharacterized protein YgiM (DUF1202 family)
MSKRKKITAVLMITVVLCMAGCCAWAESLCGNGKISVYREASDTSRAVCSLLSGTPVEVISHSGEWTEIRVRGSSSLTGYVARENVGDGQDATYGATAYSDCSMPTVSLRSRAGDSYEVTEVIPSGTSVRVLGVSGSYKVVQTPSGKVGCLAEGEIR